MMRSWVQRAFLSHSTSCLRRGICLPPPSDVFLVPALHPFAKPFSTTTRSGSGNGSVSGSGGGGGGATAGARAGVGAGTSSSSGADNSATLDGIPKSSLGENANSPQHMLAFTLLTSTKQKIESDELNEADRYLQLAAAVSGTTSAPYLYLLSMLRLKQHRLEEAAQARDSVLSQFPELMKNPIVLSNFAWLYVHQQQPEKALELLKQAEEIPDAPLELLYIRALVYTSQNHPEKAELLLRKQVIDVQGRLIPLRKTVDVQLGMLYVEVLVALDKAKQADALCGPLLEASIKLHGAQHMITLSVIERRAEVFRALGKIREAIAMLEPVYESMNKKLGAHELTLSSLGLLARTYFEAYVQNHVSASVSRRAASSGLRGRVNFYLGQWAGLARKIAPKGPELQHALQHKKMFDLLSSLEDPAAPSPNLGSPQSVPIANRAAGPSGGPQRRPVAAANKRPPPTSPAARATASRAPATAAKFTSTPSSVPQPSGDRSSVMPSSTETAGSGTSSRLVDALAAASGSNQPSPTTNSTSAGTSSPSPSPSLSPSASVSASAAPALAEDGSKGNGSGSSDSGTAVKADPVTTPSAATSAATSGSASAERNSDAKPPESTPSSPSAATTKS